jgi:isoquinoline 1-oxidoreductase alpha subunit
MAKFNVKINGKVRQVDVDPSTPILWVLRDHLDLQGTKYGCGMAQCGACTVHLNGNAVRSCQCGYCQAGQIMSAVALLKNKPKPTDEDINAFMSGNICRCGTYTRIKAAILAAAKS